MTQARPTVISLFSGAGGLDYGLEAAEFSTLVCVEFDRACCETLRRSRPGWRVIERDVFEVRSEDLLAAAGCRRGEVDLVVGGPPCQPFSKAGYWHRGDSRRLDDPRAETLGAYLRIVEDVLPRAFLLENVEGLAFAGKDEALSLLRRSIDEINGRTGARYAISTRVLNSADFGAPQSRARFFLVAARDGRRFEFPAATHREAALVGHEPAGSAEAYRTAWDAIGDLDVLEHPGLTLRGKWAELLPSVPEGRNYLWHTERGGGRPLFGWRTRYWTFLLKLAKDRPAWTLQAQPGPSAGPFHWRNRRLSTLELARLQTFPDNVVFGGNHAATQKQIGNAVASVVTEVLGRSIRTQLLDLPALGTPLRLIPPQRLPVPAPEPVLPVSDRYRGLEGRHTPHPGTGRGPLGVRLAGERAGANG